jgi:predicted AAA+ superfamily ATPase
MNRHFNIAGPCISAEHYLLPSISRLPSIFENIEKKLFFVIHAARQSGKTTLLKHLEQDINGQGKYIALYCSLERYRNSGNPRMGYLQF